MGRRRDRSTGGEGRAEQRAIPLAGEGLAFPGQGVDPTDLARVLGDHDGDPLVQRLAGLLGTDAWATLDLLDTRVAQPAVFVASLVQAAATPIEVAAVFGHSLGELSACAYAGAFSPSDGLDLVVRRAELGHAAHERRPGRMVVVMRLDAPAVEWVRRSVVARGAGVLELAVVNGPGQFVLSGDLEATAIALDLIAEAGGVGRPLAIGGGYHSPLLAEAVAPLTEAIEAIVGPGDLTVPFVSCTSQTIVRSAAELPVVLARSLVLPVRWVETVQAVRALGVTAAVDAGPSQTLANLAKFSPVIPFRALSPDPDR
jgi:[acyl-carrier-protein] S-malonyltransferase